MSPSLLDGDIVFFKEYILNKSKIEIGDIVIFDHPLAKITLIKRIKTIRKFGIEVSGDNEGFSNDSNYFGFIQKEKITGIVTSRIRYKSFLKLNNLFN